MAPDASSDSAKSDDPRSAQASQRNPLPFEPTKSRKQAEKKTEKKPTAKAVEAKPKAAKASTVKPATAKPASSSSASRSADPSASARMNIPDVVSKRMVRRMALFCGVPSVLGMATFVTSYFLVIRDIVELPNIAVVLVSMGFFGLGVLGLSYGVLSASWEEEEVGSALGVTEFGINLKRMVGAWRSQGKKS
jgi:Photosynthesis affected mutant 68